MDKDDFNKLVGRVRGRVGEHLRGNKESYKTTAKAAGVGGAAAFARENLTKNVEFLQNHWWAEGAAMAVGGHFLAQKSKTMGHALAGVGGFLLAEAYMANNAQQKNAGANQPTGANANFRQSARGMEDASSHDDASALVNSAFTSLPEASAFIDASGLRDTDFTSDVVRTRDAGAVIDASADVDASDALDL
jgi:hypothetical protein